MADFARFIRRSPKVSVSTIYADIKHKPDSDEFIYNGSQMFHGMQGEGKTVSMYKYGMDLYSKFTKSVIVTNLHLNNLSPIHVNDVSDLRNLHLYEPDYWKDKYIYVSTFDDVMKALKMARNDIYGVIFMIDEIHTYFHSHDSKALPMWVAQVFSQQRKQRLVILGTVQDWQDLIKIIRSQAKNLILCHKISYFITHTVVDPRMMETEYGESFFPVKKKGFFFLSKEIRDGMDTYQVIDSGRSVLGSHEISNGVQKDKRGVPIRKTSTFAASRKSKTMEK